MVSNVLDMEQGELVTLLKSYAKKYAEDPEYREARAALPKAWPF